VGRGPFNASSGRGGRALGIADCVPDVQIGYLREYWESYVVLIRNLLPCGNRCVAAPQVGGPMATRRRQNVQTFGRLDVRGGSPATAAGTWRRSRRCRARPGPHERARGDRGGGVGDGDDRGGALAYYRRGDRGRRRRAPAGGGGRRARLLRRSRGGGGRGAGRVASGGRLEVLAGEGWRRTSKRLNVWTSVARSPTNAVSAGRAVPNSTRSSLHTSGRSPRRCWSCEGRGGGAGRRSGHRLLVKLRKLRVRGTVGLPGCDGRGFAVAVVFKGGAASAAPPSLFGRRWTWRGAGGRSTSCRSSTGARGRGRVAPAVLRSARPRAAARARAPGSAGRARG
jgi:hypothetical protein